MKNWKNKAVSTALALSLLVPSASFAAEKVISTGDETGNKVFIYQRLFQGEKKENVKTNLTDLVEKYSPESLEEWKNTIAERDQLFAQLKEKNPLGKQRPELSEEVKAKVQELHEGMKNGTITPEKAQEELKALGIENFRGKGMKQLTDEEKEKMQTFREGIKNGTITSEQAQEELKALGINGIKGFDKENHPMAQLKKAVEDNDEAKIKELLAEHLLNMKEQNKKLLEKLAELNK